MKQNNYTPMFN